MTKQDIIDYIMETPGNTNPAILNQMIDEVGGGGSGDFSTCTGTFIVDEVTSRGGVSFGNLAIIDTENKYYGTDGGICTLYGAINVTTTETVILYKGKQEVGFGPYREGDIVSISGGIQLKENGMYEITDDFTMHVLAAASV